MRSFRCQGTTRKGEQCLNAIHEVGGYCVMHRITRCGNRMTVNGDAKQPCKRAHGHAGKCEPYAKCPDCHRRRCRGGCAVAHHNALTRLDDPS